VLHILLLNINFVGNYRTGPLGRLIITEIIISNLTLTLTLTVANQVSLAGGLSNYCRLDNKADVHVQFTHIWHIMNCRDAAPSLCDTRRCINWYLVFCYFSKFVVNSEANHISDNHVLTAT